MSGVPGSTHVNNVGALHNAAVRDAEAVFLPARTFLFRRFLPNSKVLTPARFVSCMYAL